MDILFVCLGLGWVVFWGLGLTGGGKGISRGWGELFDSRVGGRWMFEYEYEYVGGFSPLRKASFAGMID